MFETFIIFLLAIVIIFIFSFLIFLLGKLYFKHYDKKNIGINEKYFFGDKLIKTDKVSINLHLGWEGGYVNDIETEADFYCALFSYNGA